LTSKFDDGLGAKMKTPQNVKKSNSTYLEVPWEAPFSKINIFVELTIENHELKKNSFFG